VNHHPLKVGDLFRKPFDLIKESARQFHDEQWKDVV
jgi:hypothetical protein